jgi:beta-glucosidase/6-phospho-beta-glucosidase/beta-galactosidase
MGTIEVAYPTIAVSVTDCTYLQLEGYIPKFGVTAVDREDGNKRYPKKSSAFLKRFFDSAVKV